MGSDERSVSPAYVGLTQVQALVPSQVLQRLWGRTVERDSSSSIPAGLVQGTLRANGASVPESFFICFRCPPAFLGTLA